MTVKPAPVVRIIEYGQSNLGSIRSMLLRLGVHSLMTFRSRRDRVGDASSQIVR